MSDEHDAKLNVLDFVEFKEKKEREVAQTEVQNRVNKRLEGIPIASENLERLLYHITNRGFDLDKGVFVFPQDEELGDSMIVFNFGNTVNIELQRAVLNKAARRINAQLAQDQIEPEEDDDLEG